jgi:hypothetical protein
MGQRGGWPYIDPAHARKCFRFDKKIHFLFTKKELSQAVKKSAKNISTKQGLQHFCF